MSKAEIEKLLEQALSLITEAEEIANSTGETFHFDLAYGMGGTYYPERMSKDDALALLRSGKDLSAEQRKNIAKIIDEDDNNYYNRSGWVSSSSMC
jgi:hypothetical protein